MHYGIVFMSGLVHTQVELMGNSGAHSLYTYDSQRPICSANSIENHIVYQISMKLVLLQLDVRAVDEENAKHMPTGFRNLFL